MLWQSRQTVRRTDVAKARATSRSVLFFDELEEFDRELDSQEVGESESTAEDEDGGDLPEHEHDDPGSGDDDAESADDE